MSYRILLVEDNKLDINLFKQMLGRTDLDISLCEAVETLGEGLEMIHAMAPDIIFLDITLSDSQGIDTFHRIQKRANDIPVVIITGNEDEQLALEALRDGAQDYLLKSKISPILISRSLLYSMERKKIELELKRSKAKHEAIIENTKDGIWAVDVDFRFITLNTVFTESIQKLTGRKPETGDRMLDYFPAVYHEWFKDLFEKAKNGQRSRVETELSFSKQNHHLELSVNPIQHSGESISGISFFARNIEQRKQAELKIKKTEDAYKLLLQTINEGVMFIDNENIIQFANRKFIETTGYTETELTGMDFGSLLAESDQLFKKNIVSELLNNEDPKEILFVSRSGQPVWFSVKGTPLMNEYGVVGGTLLTHTEITDRKKAEQTIIKQNQDYSDLLETMNEGLIYLDDEGALEFANGKFETLTGFSAKTLMGKKLPAQLLPEQLLQILTSENTEDHIQYEIQITKISGEEVWCLINCSIIKNENSKFSGLLITYADISNRKKTEAKLKDTQSELNTFIYRSSHDLKGPLSSILGLLNILEKESESSGQSPCIKMIKQSAEKLDKMLNEMLNVVRIKKENIFPEQIDFYNQMNEVVVGLRTCDAFYDVQRKITIENKLPIHTDKKLFNLVLHNLMDNAIKYRNSKDDAFVSVTITDYMHGIKIFVEDNGVGFNDAARENAFNMFNKGNYNSQGNGLGLYVVKNAVDRLGGYIELTSNAGENTRFTIFLPNLYSENKWAGQAVVLAE